MLSLLQKQEKQQLTFLFQSFYDYGQKKGVQQWKAEKVDVPETFPTDSDTIRSFKSNKKYKAPTNRRKHSGS